MLSFIGDGNPIYCTPSSMKAPFADRLSIDTGTPNTKPDLYVIAVSINYWMLALVRTFIFRRLCPIRILNSSCITQDPYRMTKVRASKSF